ncbi:hypothetical protein Rt10032_c34g6897 [Rhodotorula toruloides]|uniref:Copia-type polyprotein n=1 Tax=Rhodotorula toruloides TaxID=5286 RepID=A0A511KR81_RHOTO|nr:hypothetical protein Rt10032_c34g6897 [Rhodotorula toruloides]
MTPIEEQQQEELEEPAPMEEPAQAAEARCPRPSTSYGHTPAGVAVALVNVAVEPSDIEDTQFAILNIPQPALATKKAFSIVGRPVPKQPPSTKEALSSIYSTEWKEGMNEEWAGFQQQDVVGDLIPREPDMKVLGTRWHHTARVDPKAETAQLKSRLVVQGVKTIPFLSSFGPTFTPSRVGDVISLFFVLATRLKLPVYSSVQLSTFQAELNAVVVALGELEWISSVISSLPIGNDAPLHLFNDNLSAVNALLSPTYIELKKQHDLKLKYIREQVEKGFVDLRWYIRGTLDYGLEYTPDSSPLRGFEAYSDSDWGACPTTSRSTVGYVFLLANGAVSWASKLQPRVTASSTEAEYLGLSHACKETVYLTQLLGKLGFPAEGAAVLYGDNQGANALSKDPQFHNRTRHLRLTEHFVREQVQDGSICVEYIPTARMLADAMTKALPAPLFERHRDAFGVHPSVSF